MKIDPQKLELCLARKCMSTNDLLKKSGVSSQTLARAKKGAEATQPKAAGRIARALGVDVLDILAEEG